MISELGNKKIHMSTYASPLHKRSQHHIARSETDIGFRVRRQNFFLIKSAEIC